MNWPLKSRAANVTPPLEGRFPSWLDQFWAHRRDEAIRNDAWNHRAKIEADIMENAYKALEGPDYAKAPEFQAGMRAYGQSLAMGGVGYNANPRDIQKYAFRLSDDEIFDGVKSRRQSDPGNFSALPASREELDREVERRRKKELEDAATVLRYGDSRLAAFGGAATAALTDEYSLPLLFVGGGTGTGWKGLAKFMVAEGALNATAEVPMAFKRRAVAEDMGEPISAGETAGQIVLAGVAGAAFAGVLGGAGRVLSSAPAQAASDAIGSAVSTGARALGRPAGALAQGLAQNTTGLRAEISRTISYAAGRRRAEGEMMAAEGAGLDGELATDAAEAALRKGQEPPVAQVGGIDFGAVERKYGLPDGYLARTAQLESRGNPAAQNPNSSAGGLFQFIDETAAAYGLDNRFDPAAATDAAARLARDNAATLRRVLGREPTAAELYLAHQQGGAGAARLLAHPDLRAADLVGAEQVRLNGGNENMSARDFANLWLARHEGTTGAQVAYDPNARYSGPARGAGRGDFSTRVDEVAAPNGMRAPVRYRIVDASDLRPASGDLQPRDRTRAGSDEQIAEISARLDPSRLMPSPEADRGTPIIGPDMVVESGNGRVAALNRAATENPAAYAAYVDAIKAHAEIPERVTRPVLVAERTNTFTAEERRAWVRGANTSAIARMAPSEQARLEGDYLTARSFDGYQPGRGLNAPENAGFVRGMLALMPQAERAALLTAEGRLNIDGLRRIRQALFARAFGADDLLRMAAETENPAIEGLLRMLEDIAPDWAAFRSMVDAGYLRPEFDITDALMEAVRLIAKSRTEKLDGQGVLAAIRDRLAQADLFGDRDPLVEALIGAFFKGKRARPAEAVGEILRRYAAEAAVVGRADMADIFDAPVTPAQALARAVEGFDGRTAYAPVRAPETAPSATPVAPLGDIAALDPERFAEGAASPAIERANDAIEAELRAGLEDGPFGKVFAGHESDPEGAIALLMREKQGEVRRAVVREDLGEIALIYGNDAMGLRHIEAKHPEILPRLPEILRNGALVGKLSDRAYLQIPGEAPASAVIRLTYDGKDHAWLVTAFDDERGQIARQLRTSDEPTARASSRIPDATGRNDITATGPENQPVGAPELDAARDAFAMRRDAVLPTGEGSATVTVGEVLDDLQSDADLITAMTSCALKGVF